MPDAPYALRPVDFDPFGPAAGGRSIRLPLTEPQAEMWTAVAMGPEANCVYNQCFSVELCGPLRVDSLSTALDQAVARHDALRTVIVSDGTYQEIREPFPVPMPLVDLSNLDSEERQQRIQDLLDEESRTPFDLAEGPLIRAFVVRESQERHRFVLTVHHIVCDGWSSSVLFADIGVLYSADRSGVPAHLGAVASFVDYVAQQTDTDYVAAAKVDEDYWAEQFPSGAPVLELPLARARPARKTFHSSRAELRVGSELYAAVKSTGARAGATLFATLLATYETLIYRLSGQTEFVIGIPFAGQPSLENPALVAHCVSTVPLRARLDPAAPFTDHLRVVRRTLADAQDHPHLTFGRLVRRLNIPRDPTRTPLVTNTFTTDKMGAAFGFGDLTVASITTPKSYSNFELLVTVVDNGTELVVECEHNTDLFERVTVLRWLSHYETLLRGIVDRPDCPLDELALVSEQQLGDVDSWDVASDGVGGCLHVRFEEQAMSRPNRTAVVCGGDSLTYGELNQRANALALRLRSTGVRRGDLVGLRTERSPSLVVGILGILKSGAAYLPLDPAYPSERVQFMLADSAVKVVVTESEARTDLGQWDASVVLIDTDCGTSLESIESSVQPDDLAYVMYTSGSTGEPKGVMITHRNVAQLFDSTSRWFGFGEDDVWSLFHSYAFDFSVWEMWGALLYGGRLVVVPYDVSRSPEEFRQLVLREGVTVLNQTPSAFRQFIAADERAVAPGKIDLRYVIFGGESLELSSLRGWFDRHGDVRPQLVNMYGITETTVHVTYKPISIEDLQAGAGSPIGVPIPDVCLFLLDKHKSHVPTGVVGEIYVGGGGVSPGYLGRAELTAQRFVPNPFGDTPARLYRTGDLARRRENGELEYVGRMDDQVKIRGFRIELGEIETLLVRHPGVADAVVLAREDDGFDKRLVAYVVADGQQDQLIDQLKSHLRARLPEYMVPTHYVTLPGFPLTPNGKTDRKVLPVPEYGRREAERPYLSPRTSTESRIASIWSDVIGVSQISVEDNFFDLGGHSLNAAQIVQTVASEFGVEVAMRHLFEQPTVAGLASIVDLLAVSGVGTAGNGQSDREEIEL